MKKLINSIFVIVAAMVTFAGCVKEEIAAPETKTVQFFAEEIATKTEFGTPNGTTYPTLWNENDEVHISLNLTSSKQYAVVPSDDFTTATIEGSFTDDESGSYTFYSVSPASALYTGFNAEHKSYSLEIPTIQTPSATSVDAKAQILVATSKTHTEFPETVGFAYQHLTAYGKMSLTNLNLNGAKVASVSLTASKNFAYRYYFYPATGEVKENGATSTITINTSSVADIWFACAPVDMSNSTMNVVVNTDKGTFTKTVNFPADRKFESGKIAKFSVDMSGVAIVSPKIYELVTDITELSPDSQVIIVGDVYAIGTNQKTNNRGAAAVNLSDDKSTVSTPGSDVQIFTIEEGIVEGTVAFNTGAGYIYAASSSSNQLKTQDNLDANASWLVTIEEGVTNIVAQGTNTRNVMQYNPNNGSPMFACYASASQKPVSIYKLQGTGTVLENYLKVSTTAIDVDADATSASFTVSSDLQWTATASGAGVSVSIEGNTVTVSFAANTANTEKVITVTVSADGVESKTVTITQAKKITKTQLTVAEFLELPDNADDLYELTGVITGIYQAYNSSYNNISFYLTDATGTITIYRMSCEGIDHTKVAVGNTITVRGPKGSYNNQGQMAQGGVCLSIIEVTAAPIITCSDNFVTITAQDGAVIYFTTDGTEPTISAELLYDEPYELEESCTVKAIAVKEGLPQSVVVEKYCTYVEPSTGGDEETTEGGKADFETVTSTNTSYVTSTTTAGWVATNCAVLKGGSTDSNPTFKCFGDEATRAFCMNGKTTAVGTIASPVLSGGCGTLSFNYTYVFSESKNAKFKVEIIQSGSVVKTFTVDGPNTTKFEIHTENLQVNVAGEFSVKFTNLSPSNNSSSNKDRVAIWNVEWTGKSN